MNRTSHRAGISHAINSSDCPAQDLLAVNLSPGATLTVTGNSHTIDGGHTTGATGFRGILVYAGTVTLRDIAINDAIARGGMGGSGEAAGGGGAGLAADCSSPPAVRSPWPM